MRRKLGSVKYLHGLQTWCPGTLYEQQCGADRMEATGGSFAGPNHTYELVLKKLQLIDAEGLSYPSSNEDVWEGHFPVQNACALYRCQPQDSMQRCISLCHN